VRPDDLKALYRRGTAYSHIGKLEAAEEDLIKAQKLDPTGG
jgi:Flp pilus assembly protein TadD